MTDFDDLGAVLDRATDGIDRHFDPTDVLATARRRRVRQRGIISGALAAVAVVAVVVSLQTVGADQATREVPPATQTPTVSAGQSRWDPRDTDSLPAASEDVAPRLPDVLRVPDLAPRVEDDPVAAAVLSIDDGADILLLGTDGRWRCVVVPDKTRAEPVLTPDGTHLVILADSGVVTVDLASGDQTEGSLPSPDPGWDSPPLVPAAKGWVVRPVAELVDGSMLLRVEPPRRSDRPAWWLVQWDPASDTFSLVTSVHSDPDKSASFARDLLGRP